MIIRRAYILNTGSHLALCLETDEGKAYVETPKQRVLQVAAILSGADVWDGKVETTTLEVPADPADGLREPFPIPFSTQDPVALELARRFATGVLGDEPAEIPVPSFEEADAAKWALEGGKLVRK